MSELRELAQTNAFHRGDGLMGESYSMEMVERAEQLYCVEGLTFDAVAEATGIAGSTLKRWSETYGWQESREKIRSSLSKIRANKIALRAKAMEKCMESFDPQNVYALAALERVSQRDEQIAARKAEALNGAQNVQMDRPAIFVENLKFIAEVLKEVDPEGLKVLAASFDEIVARFKAQNEKG
jgi:transposase-like protein